MHVTLLAAQSLDGFITRHDTPGTSFTSAADKAHFPAALRAYDCSVMGSETYRVSRDFIRKNLNAQRRRVVLSRRPQAWSEDGVPGQLEFSDEAPAALLQRLAGLGHQRCALLGGGQIHRLFFHHGLIDRVVLSLEPQLFGAGTPLVSGAVAVSLRLVSCERLAGSDTLLATYDVVRQAP